MALNSVSPGKSLPDDVNVIIEIPRYGDPIKYEVDKDTGAMFVDRFMSTAMHYPCNYGYVPNTLCGDGDPADVMVISSLGLLPGSVIRCRPVGVLKMTDESGQDSKILAAPVDKITPMHEHIQSIEHVPSMLCKRIEHFFAHYKDLEDGKWVKIEGWHGVDVAKQEIVDSIACFKRSETNNKN